jgi:methylated-DNA-[protein]-cysteine S-methyltransferase
MRRSNRDAPALSPDMASMSRPAEAAADPGRNNNVPTTISYYKTMHSPIGMLTLVAREKSVTGIFWKNDDPRRMWMSACSNDNNHPVLVKTERQLNEYFDGTRKTFSLRLELEGTEFQNKVWRAVLEIPFGETRSYGQIAKEVGNARAMRAVGAANGKNPFCIVVPSHRVVGAAGIATGGGIGLDCRRFLLALESDCLGRQAR